MVVCFQRMDLHGNSVARRIICGDLYFKRHLLQEPFISRASHKVKQIRGSRSSNKL